MTWIEMDNPEQMKEGWKGYYSTKWYWKDGDSAIYYTTTGTVRVEFGPYSIEVQMLLGDPKTDQEAADEVCGKFMNLPRCSGSVHVDCDNNCAECFRERYCPECKHIWSGCPGEFVCPRCGSALQLRVQIPECLWTVLP
jgi:hypothetical protein